MEIIKEIKTSSNKRKNIVFHSNIARRRAMKKQMSINIMSYQNYIKLKNLYREVLKDIEKK